MKKGELIDEKIILLKRSRRNRLRDYNLLTDEIPVNGKWTRFQWFSLFDEKFRILLPENFEQLPEQIAKVRYITVYRPPIILTDPDFNVNFGFHLLTDEGGDLDELICKMRDTVLFHAPETVVYEKGSILPSDMEGRWFEYKNFTVDEETYNMQFLIRSGNYLLVGTFNCRMIHYDWWKPLVLKSLEQIERIEKGTQTDESR